ncbi:SUF system NifU family Fe-S cluster assembly protein [Acidobacteria bacterium AH-259-O06]|nr:SUF system NifU family Fe-S cluster assembly protein [Acidobacteria bacterium AH-259-G07]MDA2929180.1 SUF system NifU family Fe-S cluster assembly protein [Acidobacteria bacterium AH-259-O06]
MSYLDDLYQEIILDHSKKPRNFKELSDANHKADGYNPLCGDKVSVYLKLEDGFVEDISFMGSGCAISTASASLMTQTLKGKSLGEIETLFKNFHNLVTGKSSASTELGKLAVFHGVSQFPVRVKCATLVWHTLQAAIKSKPETVSTE